MFAVLLLIPLLLMLTLWRPRFWPRARFLRFGHLRYHRRGRW
jgi:hypothetical protein